MVYVTGNRLTAEINRQDRLGAAIQKQQAAVSSGKRLEVASDDPVAAARISQLRQAEANDAVWSQTITLARSLASQADGVMRALADHMSRAQELAIAAGKGDASSSDRDVMAAELRVMADDIDSLSRTTSSLGKPLFAEGDASQLRFDGDTVFAPVPSRDAVFSVDGTSLADVVRTMADQVSAGGTANLAAVVSAAGNAVDHVAARTAQIGVDAARIERIDNGRSARAIAVAEERSALEDTDLTEAIARLSAQNLTLEAAQATFARINRQSLFDLLR
jgi:flagellar hook-associated protein 3 FlgL